MATTLMGLPEGAYNALASQHSKNNIFLWMVAGLGYNFWTGHLVSLSSLLLFFPGIFLISFASMLTFAGNALKIQVLTKIRGRRRLGLRSPADFPILVRCTIWWFVDLLFPIALAVVTVRWLNGPQ